MKTEIRKLNLVRRGFTLIELLLVLVILAVLAAVVVPKFTKRSEEAKVAAAKADIASFKLALDTYEIDNSRFPSSEEGLQALVTASSTATNWKGPYVEHATENFKDPWGNPYIYRYPGQHNTNGYDLYSYGPDGREGNDDIDNWTKK
jgi:general secretion pathway protein G